MKRIISKLNAALQVILLAPVKLPSKAMHVIKYVALSLGILQKVLDDEEKGEEDEAAE